MFCDYYSVVVCIYIFSCSFSFILNTKFVKKRPKIYFFLSAWENFWRHNGFPKRHSGAKAPLLLTLIFQLLDKTNALDTTRQRVNEMMIFELLRRLRMFTDFVVSAATRQIKNGE